MINALDGPKPSRNYKWHMDNSGEYRQQWFDFKKKRHILWIKEQIEDSNIINNVKTNKYEKAFENSI